MELMPTATAPTNGVPPQPLPVGAPLGSAGAFATRPRDYEVFDIPETVPLPVRTVTLRDQRYAVLGFFLVLLTPEEDKRAAQRAGANADNAMILAVLKATEALRFIQLAPIATTLDAGGKPVETPNLGAAIEFACSIFDGTAEGAYSAFHPAIRELVVLGYSVASSVGEVSGALFAKSRRSVTR